MKIVKVICSKGRTGFFFDDQRAIKQGAVADGAAAEMFVLARDGRRLLELAQQRPVQSEAAGHA